MNKKLFTVILLFVLAVSVLTACSVNIKNENVSATAVTDSQGQTHIYEPVTDAYENAVTADDGNGVFAEIETGAHGEPLTKKDGKYVTNENTTVLTVTKDSDNTTAKPPSTNKAENADNDVSFAEASQNNTKATEENTSQSVTDEDGWITKWY